VAVPLAGAHKNRSLSSMGAQKKASETLHHVEELPRHIVACHVEGAPICAGDERSTTEIEGAVAAGAGWGRRGGDSGS
jgi:hypothetical protein